MKNISSYYIQLWGKNQEDIKKMEKRTKIEKKLWKSGQNKSIIIRMGGVSIISGTLCRVCREPFPTSYNHACYLSYSFFNIILLLFRGCVKGKWF